MGVTIKGLSSLEAKINKLNPLAIGALERGVQKAALKVEGDAKMITPVDTGALRDSITISSNSTTNGAVATIGSSLEYAPYVELGTSKSSAQPFLQPALQKNKKTAVAIVMGEVRSALKGI